MSVPLIMHGIILLVLIVFVQVIEFLMSQLARVNALLDLIGMEFNVSHAMIIVYGWLILLLVTVLLEAINCIIPLQINVLVYQAIN